MAAVEPLGMGAASPEERVKSSAQRTEQIERRKELMRRGERLVVILFLAVLIAIGAAGLRETQSAATSAESAATDAKNAAESAEQSAKNSKAVTDFVASCTTPGRKCYEEQKQQDRAEQGAANSITYLANSCADQPGYQTERDIRRCVAAGLLTDDDSPSGDQTD